jgi:hypothetical protein
MIRKMASIGDSESPSPRKRRIKVSGVKHEQSQPLLIELLEQRLGIDSKLT